MGSTPNWKKHDQKILLVPKSIYCTDHQSQQYFIITMSSSASSAAAKVTHVTESISDRKAARELAEARQSGAVAPAIDVSSGKIINPHNPEFVSFPTTRNEDDSDDNDKAMPCLTFEIVVLTTVISLCVPLFQNLCRLPKSHGIWATMGTRPGRRWTIRLTWRRPTA